MKFTNVWYEVSGRAFGSCSKLECQILCDGLPEMGQ